jgi:hypothetical protein
MDVRVERVADGEFRVTVMEGRTRSSHVVRVSPEEQQRFGGNSTPEELVEQSFRFLLERESKEAILQTFDLSVIERYFPEFGEEIGKQLG